MKANSQHFVHVPPSCHGAARGSQERGGEELLLNTLLEYRDRWRHVHAPQGRLDSTQRQGNTGLLKGRLN